MIYTLISLLFFIALIFLFEIDIKSLALDICRADKTQLINILKNKLNQLSEKVSGSRSFKKQVEIIRGVKKENIIAENINQAKRILSATKQQSKIKYLYTACVSCCIVGMFLGIILKNIFLIPVLGCGSILIPLWFIRYNEFEYTKRASQELSVALSLITTSYTRTEDFVSSVKENLIYFSDDVRQAFSEFVGEVEFLSGNSKNAIITLSKKYKSHIFKQWCNNILLCLDNRSFKYSLNPIVEQFRYNKELQESMETTIRKPVKSYAFVAAVAVAILPLLSYVNPELAEVATGTVIGKLLIAVLSVIILYGINQSISLSTPVDL
ncbi:MAG: hypothetical protein RSF81_08020 [Oscillospiraceae bacterium]